MLLNCGDGEDSLESLGQQEIQPVHSKGNQLWTFIARTDAEAETPILWPPDAKYWLIGKNPGSGKDWGWEEKGTTEDEMAGWHYQLNGHEFEWTPGVGEGQRGWACCSSWGRRVGHDWVTELNWTELKPNNFPWWLKTVKNLHAMWETWVPSLGWEDPLEEGMATHSSILAWRIPWTEELGRLQSIGSWRVGHDWVMKHSTHPIAAEYILFNARGTFTKIDYILGHKANL